MEDLIWRSVGSSPRVRGTEHQPSRTFSCKRFIPACAGNRKLAIIPDGFPPVHPRVCGEQSAQILFASTNTGSSPRVRGTVCCGFPEAGAPRFIPACAGNRQPTFRAPFPMTVHPRVCGEQKRSGRTGVLLDGSSPRVRGTVTTPEWRDNVWRFIPACAGNRTNGRSTRGTPAVHPRVCGEQYVGPRLA